MKIETTTPYFIGSALLLIIIGLFFVQDDNLQAKPSTLNFGHDVTVGQAHIFAAFATTQAEQTTGLSGQTSLDSNQGLLFIFDHPDYYGIWMKDMNFPIDVIWFDSNKQVIFIKESFLPVSYHKLKPEIINPPAKTSYILEVPSGFVQSNQIKVGDLLSF